jgi:flagellar biosynthetic protein FliO
MIRWARLALAPVAVALATSRLLAADPALPAYQPPAPAHLGGGSTSWLLARMLVSLALVVGLIYLTAWLARMRGTLAQSPAGYRLRVIETVALGPNRGLHLVAVGRTVLLLGAGNDGLRTLATFSAAEAGYDPESASPPAENFLSRLQALRGGGDLPAAAESRR